MNPQENVDFFETEVGNEFDDEISEWKRTPHVSYSFRNVLAENKGKIQNFIKFRVYFYYE